MPPLQSFEEFWPFYLREHSQPETRALHIAGTTASLICLVGALGALLDERRRNRAAPAAWLAAAALCGYGAAWLGHMAFEGNRPATFRHPAWSLRADLRMWRLWACGELESELERCAADRG